MLISKSEPNRACPSPQQVLVNLRVATEFGNRRRNATACKPGRPIYKVKEMWCRAATVSALVVLPFNRKTNCK